MTLTVVVYVVCDQIAQYLYTSPPSLIKLMSRYQSLDPHRRQCHQDQHV